VRRTDTQEPVHPGADHRDPARVRGLGEARGALRPLRRVADDVLQRAGRLWRDDGIGRRL